MRALWKVQFDTTTGCFLDGDDQLPLFNFIAGATDLRVVPNAFALPTSIRVGLRDTALHMIRSSIAPVVLLGLGLGIAQARVDEPPAGLTVVDRAQIRPCTSSTATQQLWKQTVRKWRGILDKAGGFAPNRR